MTNPSKGMATWRHCVAGGLCSHTLRRMRRSLTFSTTIPSTKTQGYETKPLPDIPRTYCKQPLLPSASSHDFHFENQMVELFVYKVHCCLQIPLLPSQRLGGLIDRPSRRLWAGQLEGYWESERVKGATSAATGTNATKAAHCLQ